GAEGAGVATMVARLTEMCIVTGYSYFRKLSFTIKGTGAFIQSRSFLSLYTKTCLPVLLNEMLWSLGMTAYKVGYAMLGVDTLACINVSESIANFFFIFVMGLGNATTILLGQILGKGDIRGAREGARLILRTAFTVGCVMGLSMALTAPLFTGLFNVSADIRHMAERCLFVKAVFQPLCSINMVLFVGILRAGGDTRYSLIAETSCVWLIGVTMSFLGAGVLRLPIYTVVAMTSLEEVSKLFLCYPRYRSEKWIKSLAKPTDK
ncbi:MAG: MATE family efflux transporter, partial [Bullifex sp.]